MKRILKLVADEKTDEEGRQYDGWFVKADQDGGFTCVDKKEDATVFQSSASAKMGAAAAMLGGGFNVKSVPAEDDNQNLI